MRLVKAALFAGLLTGLGVVWSTREPVLAAYRDDPTTAAVGLEGIDLDYRPVEIEPSPYQLPSAPDTRRQRPGLPVVLPDLAYRTGDGSVPVLGGKAVLEGTVQGPNGPVGGARLHAERLVGNGAGSVEAVADDNGQWRIEGVVGGRFRVRAWLPNALAMPSSDVRFVNDGDTAVFDFTLEPADPSPVLELAHGGLIYEGLATEIAVVANTFYIDDQGLTVTRPLPDVAVSFSSSGQVTTWPGEGITGTDGSVWLNVQCQVAGAPAALTHVSPDNSAGDPPSDGSSGIAGQDAGLAADQVGEQTLPPSGTLTATTDAASVSFALPGCLPLPDDLPGSSGSRTESAPEQPSGDEQLSGQVRVAGEASDD